MDVKLIYKSIPDWARKRVSLAEFESLLDNYKLTDISPRFECPECGEMIVPKSGQYGLFLTCSGFKTNGCMFKPSKKNNGDF